jgi:hypothetical protein
LNAQVITLAQLAILDPHDPAPVIEKFSPLEFAHE